MTDRSQADSFDSAWKEALDRYLPDFMRLLFPQAFVEIDWSQGYELLDTELQQVVRDAELGRRRADRLVRVARLSGERALVYIHRKAAGSRPLQGRGGMSRCIRLHLSLLCARLHIV